MSELVEIGSASDFPQGKMKKISVKGVDILVANVNGEFVSIDDICTHEECSLSTGFLRNDTVTCPCHLAQFNVKSGKVVQNPATGEKIKDTRIFKIKNENNQIFVEV